MSRRRGSATALKASEVVAALAIQGNIYSDTGICQARFGYFCGLTFFPVELIFQLTAVSNPERKEYLSCLHSIFWLSQVKVLTHDSIRPKGRGVPKNRIPISKQKPKPLPVAIRLNSFFQTA